MERIKKYFPILLIIAGAAVICYAFSAKLWARYEQNKLVEEYLRASQILQEDDTADNTADDTDTAADIVQADDTAEADTDTETAAKPLKNQSDALLTDGVEVIGVLEIPKIDLLVAIGEGTDRATLKCTAAHYESTAYPGEAGNCALAGHRNYTYGSFFNRLDEIAEGDKLYVTTNAGQYEYTVTETFVVEPEETWVLENRGGTELTLITCTPIRVATHRLIVKAQLTAPIAAEAAS